MWNCNKTARSYVIPPTERVNSKHALPIVKSTSNAVIYTVLVSLRLYDQELCVGVSDARYFLIPWTGWAFAPLGPFLCPTAEEKNGLLPHSQGPRTCIE